MTASRETRVERIMPVLPLEEQHKHRDEKQLFRTTKELPSIKSKDCSDTAASTSIYIGQDTSAGGGAMAGGNEVEQKKLPPELLQKMREVLAIGIAKSIIAKSLAELQSEEIAVGS